MTSLPRREIGRRIAELADVSYARWAVEIGAAADGHVAAEGL